MKRIILLFLILLINNLNALKLANQPTKCNPKNPKDTQMCKDKFGSTQPSIFCVSNEKLHDRSLNSSTGGYCGYYDKNDVIIIP